MEPASNQHGFSLLEMILSIAIITILSAISLPIYASYQTRTDAAVTTERVAELLRRAQVYARGMNLDSSWGVEIQSSSATLFKGTTFATRTTTYDETLTLSSSITPSGSSEIIFTKLTGTPAATGSVVLTGANNDARTISVNAIGLVSY